MSDHAPKGTKWIWNIFWLLLIVTTVEVVLGIIQPEFLAKQFLGTRILNHIFIILTLVKAFYIVEYFMHVKYENKPMRFSLYLPVLILIPYLTFILLTEGNYIESMRVMQP
ncbi:MAG: cytochrome C oxidase subunit IV family protein [Schleiferiaceae bacterium]|jgi:cytochrome c oxidase subunit IV|nr:cytochrome C oxidase subunit IV family protein [Schleiferiaceae bacterium]